MGLQPKKVKFVNSVRTPRQRNGPIIQKIEEKRGDVYIHEKSITMRVQAKRQVHKTCSKSCASTKKPSEPIDFESRTTICSEKQKQDSKYQPLNVASSKYQALLVASEESIHSSSCLMRSQARQKLASKQHSPSIRSEESIHMKHCPMRSQIKHRSKYQTSPEVSEESIHAKSCPMRFQSQQQKCIHHTSGEYSEDSSHSESCPMRAVSKQKKARKYQTSYVYSETYPVKWQTKQKKLKHYITSDETLHSESCPMRGTRQKKQKRYQSLRDYSERYSESCKLRLQANKNLETKCNAAWSEKYWITGNKSPEPQIKKRCLADFKRMTRYLQLKQKAMEAMKNRKIFTVKGENAIPVRRALLDRGWVEKLLPTKSSKIAKIPSKTHLKNYFNKPSTEIQEKFILSSFLEDHYPNLVWGRNNTDTKNTCNEGNNSIKNNLEVENSWGTRDKLCKYLQESSWYTIENVAEVDAPRTYSNASRDELREFIKDYLLTACTSLVTWVLGKVEKNQPVFNETGTVPINVIVFAINRCKEYLFNKENMDVDKKVCNEVTPGQWKFFLTKYASLVSGKELFKIDENRNMVILMAYAKCLLERINKFRPQVKCEGCYNVWIIKPSETATSKKPIITSEVGKMLTTLTNTKDTYIVQKYIEKPFLIYDTKFDIRQYYLVTSTYPLEIWTYQDCFLKFCPQNSNLLNSLHGSAHLTNPTARRHFRKRHPKLPKNNLYDLKTFKTYLKLIGKEDVWDEVIYPGLKKIIVGIMLSNQDCLKESTNCFGFYGCKFVLDIDFKPWLIEINNAPDLHPSSNVRICRRVVSDIFKVVIDYAQNPTASTGKFECIYRQPMTPPLVSAENDAYVLEINGVAVPPQNICRENEVKETHKEEYQEKESTKIPHNVENLDGKKTISKQPVLNILQKLDSLFELAIIKKSDSSNKHLNINSDQNSPADMKQTDPDLIEPNLNTKPHNIDYKDTTPDKKTVDWLPEEPELEDFLNVDQKKVPCTCIVQTESDWMIRLYYDDNLYVNQNKGACACNIQTDLDWTSQTVCNNNFDEHLHKTECTFNTQTDSGWMSGSGRDDRPNLNPDKGVCTITTQTDSAWTIKSSYDDNLNVTFNNTHTRKREFKTQTESGWITALTYNDHLDVHLNKEAHSHKTQTDLDWMTKLSYDEHLDINPDRAYACKTQANSTRVPGPRYGNFLDVNSNHMTRTFKSKTDSSWTESSYDEYSGANSIVYNQHKKVCAIKSQMESAECSCGLVVDNLNIDKHKKINFITQTESKTISVMAIEDDLDMIPDKETCAEIIKSELNPKTKLNIDDHVNIPLHKQAAIYIRILPKTTTDNRWNIKPDDVGCAFKPHADSGWVIEPGYDNYLIKTLDSEKTLSAPLTAEHVITKTDYGDHFNVHLVRKIKQNN